MVPNLWLIPIEEVAGLMGGIEQIMTIVAVKIDSDATGIALFLLNEENASKLASTLSTQDKNSVLEEIVNIIIGAALTSLSNFLKLKLIQSIPASATDMLRAIINEIVAQMGEQTDEVLLLKVSLQAKEIEVIADLYFIFDPASSKKIIISCNAQVENNG